jgi:hypothetical protein
VATHPETGEWMPPGGFARLPEPDGRELRPQLPAARLLGVVPSYMARVAKKHDLSVYTAKVGGHDANFYVLDELLELRARHRFGVPQTAATAKPSEFQVKRTKGQDSK